MYKGESCGAFESRLQEMCGRRGTTCLACRMIWKVRPHFGLHCGTGQNILMLRAAILPDLPPIEPRQLLKCPRHGHELSCLLRPSTSQRPLKSCDVRFDPQGQDRLVWDKLAQAILEKMQWSRGKRVIAKR